MNHEVAHSLFLVLASNVVFCSLAQVRMCRGSKLSKTFWACPMVQVLHTRGKSHRRRRVQVEAVIRSVTSPAVYVSPWDSVCIYPTVWGRVEQREKRE